MITESDLNQFTGSLEWTRHWASPRVIYSEGVAFLAERAEAYWLIDAIASHELDRPIQEECQRDPDFDNMHFWKLKVYSDPEDENSGKSAVLICQKDSGEPEIVRQEIPYTDFPLAEITIYAGNDGQGSPRKLYLPSEY